MTNRELDQYVSQLMLRYEEVNSIYIQKVAQHIEAIGHLNPTSINRISILAQMNENIGQINKQIADASRLTQRELYELYDRALNEAYTDARFRRALEETPLSQESLRRLEIMAQNIAIQTVGTMKNLSNTTLVSEDYQHAIDNAVLAVVSGVDDYKSATRRTVEQLGGAGIQVVYPSGYHRRLDTAVRQNITNGTKQIAQNGSIMMGEMLGYDAYEISAHAQSAPDHEPIQGHVFLKAEFAKMQNEEPFQDVDGRQYAPIRRAIGEWNCMHVVFSFSTEYSRRKYTERQLRMFAESNAAGAVIDDKHYSLYEVSQYMRRLETAVRKQKDIAIAATAAGDDIAAKNAQRKINATMAKYYEIAENSGLSAKPERTTVPGFKKVRL